jgi:hypothetical protein
VHSLTTATPYKYNRSSVIIVVRGWKVSRLSCVDATYDAKIVAKKYFSLTFTNHHKPENFPKSEAWC